MIACFVYPHSNYDSSCMLYMNAHHFWLLRAPEILCLYPSTYHPVLQAIKLPEYSRVPVQVGTHSREKKILRVGHATIST